MNTSSRPPLSLKRKLFFSAVSFLLFLLLVEGAARLWEASHPRAGIAFRQLFQRDRLLLWRLKPHADFHGLVCNAQGFRGADFVMRKPPGTIRIACVGDSCTFGGSYEPGADYPARLEAALNASATDGKRFQVYNFSGHGYTSHQGRILFQEDVLPCHPDAAIVYYGPNDYLYAAYLSDASAPLLPPWFVSMDNLFWHAASYRLVMSRSGEWRPRSLPENANAENFRDLLPRRVSPDQYADNLAAIARMARTHNVKLVLLDFRMRPEIPFMLNQIPSYDATRRQVRWFHPRPAEAGEPIARGQLDQVDPGALQADLQACPDYAAGYYARAWLAARAGRVADASADYARAAALDYDRRWIEAYRAALHRVGERYGVPVLAADEWLPSGRDGWRYFYDERHLTEEGDRLLGETLASQLRDHYGW